MRHTKVKTTTMKIHKTEIVITDELKQKRSFPIQTGGWKLKGNGSLETPGNLSSGPYHSEHSRKFADVVPCFVPGVGSPNNPIKVVHGRSALTFQGGPYHYVRICAGIKGKLTT
jgi:hypothetical protein